MADTDSIQRHGNENDGRDGRPFMEGLSRMHSGSSTYKCRETGARWEVEPNVGRVVDGFPGRVDRLKQLGNAVVPQIVEIIGNAILEAEKLES